MANTVCPIRDLNPEYTRTRHDLADHALRAAPDVASKT